MKITCLPVVMILTLASCSTYIYFEKSFPPEIEPAEKENSIAFINLFDYTKLTYTNENKIEVYINAITKLEESLEAAFSEDPDIDLIIHDTLVEGRASGNFLYDYPADSVKAVCVEAGASMLLALEAFSVYFDQVTEVEENSDGSKSRTAYFTLMMQAGFSLYDATGSLLDRSMIGVSEPYSSRPVVTAVFAIQPSLVKAGEEINFLAGTAGGKYAARFYPSSEQVTRKIWFGKEFFEADNYMMDKNWQEAIKALLPLTESAVPRIAKKAAYNLSVVYEAEGNSATSDYWLNRSKE